MIGQQTQQRRRSFAFEPQSMPPMHATAPLPEPKPSYYDLSILKPPVWSADIALYFFLGGLSGGAYILGRLSELVGGERYRTVNRAGTTLALLASLPAAPLLIHDLGDPKRFHHMLRVFKPHSPMNLGAWVLTAYSGAATVAVAREWLRGSPEEERSIGARVRDGVVFTITDAAGIPLAILLAGYTGVLLSTTSTPIWARNPWIGPVFSASAINSGAEALELVLRLFGDRSAQPALERLEKIDSLAHAAEIATFAGFLASAGELARPMLEGKLAKHFWGGLAFMAASELVKLLPDRGPLRKFRGIAAPVLGLAGGLALRWLFVYSGPTSGKDPDAARRVSQKRHDAPANPSLAV